MLWVRDIVCMLESDRWFHYTFCRGGRTPWDSGVIFHHSVVVDWCRVLLTMANGVLGLCVMRLFFVSSLPHDVQSDSSSFLYVGS